MTRQPPRQGAGSRHKSSGSLSRHWRHYFRFDGPRRHCCRPLPQTVDFGN
ncbi:hypothetical protein BF49_5821 [Bradyrhizobium sp.]|nr:hypothetical protein BF49_5821 [Bradyrhizobium sp.]